MYISPEQLIGNPRYRTMCQSEVYAKKLVGLVIDEAHCVKKWYVVCMGIHVKQYISRLCHVNGNIMYVRVCRCEGGLMSELALCVCVCVCTFQNNCTLDAFIIIIILL